MKNKPTWLVAACLLLVGLHAQAVAAPDKPVVNAAAVDAIFAQFNKDTTPGCAIGAFRDGKTLLQRNYGMADVTAKVPLTADTVFYMASVSKQFTSLAAVKLVEEGKLRLDDDIRKWLPELPGYGTPVTVRMLMNHTSGVREVLGLFALAGTQNYETLMPPEVLRMMVRQKSVNFTPGSSYTYTNGGYFLLAQVVERASGQRFDEFARRKILEPLGMNSSYFRYGPNPAGVNVAHGYVRDDAGGFTVRDTYPSFSGSGGLMSSVNDMAKYDHDFHVGHKVWTVKAREMMLAPGVLTSGKTTDAGDGLAYASGLGVGTRRGQPVVAHSGGHPAFSTNYVIFPKLAAGFVALCNLADDPGAYNQQVAEVMYPKAFSGPKTPPRVRGPKPEDTRQPVPAELMTALGVGSTLYRSEELDADYRFARDGDGLAVDVFSSFTSGGRLEGFSGLRLDSADVLRGDFGKLKLERGSDNIIKGFVLEIGRLEGGIKFTRVAPAPADLILTGGTIYDGSDAPSSRGDVVIRGDKIVYVGSDGVRRFDAARVIDVTGKVVAPGFIDPHTHPDEFIRSEDAAQRMTPAWLFQGATTLMIGVDGAGTPDIATEAQRVEKDGVGVNLGAYVGFGRVRSAVLEQDAREPTANELEQMRAMVADGMCKGAFGLSTGLFYAPQSFSKTEEVIELAKEAAKRGGIYDTHQRDESSYSIGLLESTREAIRIGREGGLPVHVAHIKALGVDVHGQADAVIALINDARTNGQQVTADQYPWLASGTALSAALLPRWAVAGGRTELLKRLDDPATLQKIRDEMRENQRRRGGAESLVLTVAGSPWHGKKLVQVAQEHKQDPIDAALAVIRDGRDAAVSFNMDNADVVQFMQQPWAVTSSDGSSGHPRQFATFPQKYREYVRKGTLTMNEFIRSSTGRTADILGLTNRGYLRAGYFADVVVFDPERYAPKADYLKPREFSEGVDELLVNGRLAIDAGKLTDRAAGKLLLHEPKAGSCP